MKQAHPYAVINKHKKVEHILFFDLHLQPQCSVCIGFDASVGDNRTRLRKILNPHYVKPVTLYRHVIKIDSYEYEETESLYYCNNVLEYRNQKTIWKIPFSESNREDILNFDYKIEGKDLNTKCCTLY